MCQLSVPSCSHIMEASYQHILLRKDKVEGSHIGNQMIQLRNDVYHSAHNPLARLSHVVLLSSKRIWYYPPMYLEEEKKPVIGE